MTSDSDRAYLEQAFALAHRHFGLTGANPSVGCVLVRQGTVLATGVTGRGGRPHAEESALEVLAASAEGAVAYVTLEPCRQRSGGGLSCSERLIAAGIVRVVAATEDAHPLGHGGFARLADAGVVVQTLPMPHTVQAHYSGFFRKV